MRASDPDIGYEVSELDPATPLLIRTPAGTVRAEIGDWIVRGVVGEFYRVEPEIFDQVYDPVESPAPAGRPAGFTTDESALADWFSANGVDEWMPQYFRTRVGPTTLTYESYIWRGPRGYNSEFILLPRGADELPVEWRTVPLRQPLTDDVRKLFVRIGYDLEEVDEDPRDPATYTLLLR